MKITHIPVITFEAKEVETSVVAIVKALGIDLQGFYFTSTEDVDFEMDGIDNDFIESGEAIYGHNEWADLLYDLTHEADSDTLAELLSQLMLRDNNAKQVLTTNKTVIVRVTKSPSGIAFTGKASTLLN